MLTTPAGVEIARGSATATVQPLAGADARLHLEVRAPRLWSLREPSLYRVRAVLREGGRRLDSTEVQTGFRTLRFDPDRGFFLNGEPTKIKGVCIHQDHAGVGVAVPESIWEFRLRRLKEMGVNGLRTSHNPPAPELLELTDKMGFIVMDEAFDMWKIAKTKFDYHLDWDEWHKRDLEDMVLRDRNHPSVIIWSIGNEVMEQWNDNPTGGTIAKELGAIVRNLDPTRPITSATNGVNTNNKVITEGGLDLVGTNYDLKKIPELPKMFPGRPIIGAETTSALGTSGTYNLQSDKILRWPRKWDEVLKEGNPDFTCSAYDNSSAPWGSTTTLWTQTQ